MTFFLMREPQIVLLDILRHVNSPRALSLAKKRFPYDKRFKSFYEIAPVPLVFSGIHHNYLVGDLEEFEKEVVSRRTVVIDPFLVDPYTRTRLHKFIKVHRDSKRDADADWEVFYNEFEDIIASGSS